MQPAIYLVQFSCPLIAYCCDCEGFWSERKHRILYFVLVSQQNYHTFKMTSLIAKSSENFFKAKGKGEPAMTGKIFHY
jgi:hypothetical protein